MEHRSPMKKAAASKAQSNDALWRNGSCSAIVLTATTGNCRARWAVEATGNEYHRRFGVSRSIVRRVLELAKVA